MSTRLKSFLSLLMLSSVGCINLEEAPSVPFSEWAEFPEGCVELIEQSSDDEIVISAAQDREDGVVLETPSQACVAARRDVADKASADRRFELLWRIRVLGRVGDPSPHPDEPARKGEQDPSPHPDATHGGEGDPSPHPDTDDDSTIAVLVIKVLGFVPRGTSNTDDGSSTPATPGPANPE